MTVKQTDFYLGPVGAAGIDHLSVHGPHQRHPGDHRFHVRVDRDAALEAAGNDYFVAHGLPRKGFGLEGEQLAPGVFRLPLPKPGEDPRPYLGGAPELGNGPGMFWFLESITSRRFLKDGWTDDAH